ncbi:hypothetical protein BGZ76_011893 [Entomortierella beljakovae]|nr:hypothetical protein BGZ76_011893 [Entomortierella beljakovae]
MMLSHSALKNTVIASVLLAVVVGYPLPQQAIFTHHDYQPASIKNLIVFGDSFSDTGNVYNLTDHVWPRPTFYPDGRFSNGPVWTDYVVSNRSLNLINYAFGGATTDSKIVQGYSGGDDNVPVPGFIQQIEDHFVTGKRKEMTNDDIQSTLSVVSFQGNDFIFKPDITPETVVENVERGVHRLVELGIQHIIVFENFNFAKVPFFQGNQTKVDEMEAISKKQHDIYQDMRKRISERYGAVAGKGNDGKTFYNCMSGNDSKGKVNIGFFDFYELSNRLYEPRYLDRLGITEVIHGCVSIDAMTGCDNPESYLFYDPYHFSTKIHREIANGVLDVI